MLNKIHEIIEIRNFIFCIDLHLEARGVKQNKVKCKKNKNGTSYTVIAIIINKWTWSHRNIITTPRIQ